MIILFALGFFSLIFCLACGSIVLLIMMVRDLMKDMNDVTRWR